MADELPQGSLLQRYGVTTDQLPAAKEPLPEEASPAPSLFPIEAEKPLVKFEFRDKSKPASTGNPSIDGINARDQQACERTRSAALERGFNYITCDDSLPGQQR